MIEDIHTNEELPALKILFTSIINMLVKTEIKADTINSELHNIAAKFGIKHKDVTQPLRVALTGSTKSPPIADVIIALGIEECVSRIYNFMHILEESSNVPT